MKEKRKVVILAMLDNEGEGEMVVAWVSLNTISKEPNCHKLEYISFFKGFRALSPFSMLS